MRAARQQRGEGRIGCVLWLLVLLAFGYLAYQVVPTLIKGSELENFMVRQAESGTRPRPEKISDSILARAKELGLPLEEKNLEVTYRGGRLTMSAEYVVPIDLLVSTWDWRRAHTLDRPVFNY